MAKRNADKEQAFDEDAIFRQMTESAFDFLYQTRADLEKKPKYAIIHFATAIELILKARLLKEHWALVVSASGDADRHGFQNGTAKTVTVDQAIKRLENIAAEHLPAGAAEAFKVIAAHRNRMIHFFHEAASAEAAEELRAQVTTELLLGWYFLVRMLRNWQFHFANFEKHIWQVENGMQSVRAYLSVVYDKVKPQIAELSAGGTAFRSCPSCQYPSVKIEPVAEVVSDLKCLVCNLGDSMVTMPCTQEDCHGTLHLTGYNTADETCDGCGQQIEKEEFAEFLDTEHAEYPDFTVKNCGLCASAGAVVKHNNLYICTNCLAYSDDISTCGWCNEMQLGYDLEDSYYFGCEFCDGKHGWGDD